MPTLYVDPNFSDEKLRTTLYNGDLVMFSRSSAVLDLVAHMRERLEQLFAPHDPEQAHRVFSPDEMAAMLGKWKPAFIHDPRSKQLVHDVVADIGMSLPDTHYDVPKPRTSFPVGHLTTGIAFAFPWHRDTWYAAPAQQINWWLPIYDVSPDNTFMFDLEKFDQPVPNTSGDFDYYEINRARRTTAKQVGQETQSRPESVTHRTASPLIPIGRPGSVLLFSGNQLHASIPNTSGRARYSIDFRTVDRRDVIAGRGAPLVDCDCTGTALRDFANLETGERFPEELVRRIHGEPPADAVLVFSGSTNDD